MKVEIDGVQYVPISEMPSAAQLMKRIAESWWGERDPHATDPREYRELHIRVSDSEDGEPTVEQFVAFLMRDGT